MITNKEDNQLGTVIAGVKLYSVREIAQLVGVTPQTIRRYIKDGRLKCRRIGRNLFSSETDLKNFVKATQQRRK